MLFGEKSALFPYHQTSLKFIGISLALRRKIKFISKQGPYRFWKVIEIENAIFHDLESFGKEMILYNGYGKVLEVLFVKIVSIS